MRGQGHLQFSINLLLVFITLALLTPSAFPADTKADSIVVDGHIHTCEQIIKMMLDSKMRYDINTVPDSEWADTFKVDTTDQTPTEQYVGTVDGERTILWYHLSDTLMTILDTAEAAFQRQDYASAISGYRRVYELDTLYPRSLVLIGDVFWKLGKLDSACGYFRHAIERNFIDYQAHWFLADALWQMGRKDEAIHEMTIAHLVNMRRSVVISKLAQYRQVVHRDWKIWNFCPKFSMMRDPADSHVVKITTTVEWAPYAMTKALWAFEPGYAEKMLGHPLDSNEASILEEKESLVCILADKKQKQFRKIVDDGYVTAFILYDVLGKTYPQAIAIQSREVIEAVAEYVKKYH
jgi:tetratricopeptide (TPR) repeat protein